MYIKKKKLQAIEYEWCRTSKYSMLHFSHCCSICERVTPRLSHANSAVVLSAVKVLMKFLELLPKDSDYYNTLLKKLSPPLVTLLSGEPEVQYVALRNINLIVQKRSECKHHSPILIKLLFNKLDASYFSFPARTKRQSKAIQVMPLDGSITLQLTPHCTPGLVV